MIVIFRFLLFTVLAYFVFRALDGLFGSRRYSQPQSRSSERKRSTFSKDDGDYVDYEEVKDDDS